MSKATFSKTIASVRRINDWYDVFPADAESKRINIPSLFSKKPPVDFTIVDAFEQHREESNAIYRAAGSKRLLPPHGRLREWAETVADESYDEKFSLYRWPGALDVVKILQRPQLHVARFYRGLRRIERDIVRIEQGLLRYGKYSKADRVCERPQADYDDAVQRFLASVKRTTPTADVRSLENLLKRTDSGAVRIERATDQKYVEEVVRQLLGFSKKTRQKGRPPDDGSILLFYLVNSLTLWQRTKNGEVRKDKKRLIKVERRWDEIARVLIWLHYKKLRIPWLAAFIKRHASMDAARAMNDLKKLLQSRYSHLSKHAHSGLTGEAFSFPLGVKRVVLSEDHLSAVDL